MRRTVFLTGIAVVTLAASTGAAVSATAAHHHRHRGKFSCEAWGANLGGKSFAVANKHYTPCYTKHGRVNKVGHTSGGRHVFAGEVTANTEMKGKRVIRAGKTKALASARAANAGVRGLVSFGKATSSASYTCVAKGSKLVPKLAVHSKVAYIIITSTGKKKLIGSKRMKFTLPVLGTIYFNRVIKHRHTVTVRAVEIDRGGTKPIIFAQSKVSYTGNPCAKKK